MAIHVAATGRLSPPRRMDDMTALLARGPGGESEAVAKLKAGADARPPEDAAPAAQGQKPGGERTSRVVHRHGIDR